MEAKNKARELVDKMLNGFQFGIDKYTAKQCALIAVDEIIELDVFDCNEDWSTEDGDTKEYWQEVKQEIEKL